MVCWSAPAKAILFGEHAVVYGEPALAVAIDRRIEVSVREAASATVNGRPMTDRQHGYIKKAVELSGGTKAFEVTTRSDIPSASGLGSSAAVTVAAVAAAMDLASDFDPEGCARAAHRVECMEESRPASPLDTAACTLGSGVLTCRERMDGHAWTVEPEGGGPAWHVHRVPVPDLTLVLGYTGLKGKTRTQVQKVGSFASRQKGFARDIMAEIGQITMEGVRALGRGDHAAVGELMDRNDRLLGILGVSIPELDRLVEAARRHSFGAKMIGAGGGGCMMALTDDHRAAADAIAHAGGVPYIVKVSADGVRKEA